MLYYIIFLGVIMWYITLGFSIALNATTLQNEYERKSKGRIQFVEFIILALVLIGVYFISLIFSVFMYRKTDVIIYGYIPFGFLMFSHYITAFCYIAEYSQHNKYIEKAPFFGFLISLGIYLLILFMCFFSKHPLTLIAFPEVDLLRGYLD